MNNSLKINTYNFLVNNDIVHAKVDELFLRKIKEKIIQKYNSLRQYNLRKLKIYYETLRHEFKINQYFQFPRLLKIARDVGISKEEVFSHVEIFFARGSKTHRELILPRELMVTEDFVEGYALYLAEGDSGSNGYTVPRKVRFTNSDLKVIRFFVQWLTTYFPNNIFYLSIIIPPGKIIEESFIRQIGKKLSLTINQIKIKNGYYNKKIKYRICCDQAIFIDLILALGETIKRLCLKDKKLAAGYIRGMMIGEGTAYFNKSRYVRIEMKNEREIKYLCRLFEELDYNYKLSLRNDQSGRWSIYIGAKQLEKFYNEIGFGVHLERQRILQKAVNKKLRINQYV